MLFSEFATTILDARKSNESCIYIESSSERLKRLLNTGCVKHDNYPFRHYPVFIGGEYPLHGLGEVKHLFVEAIDTCTVLNRRKQIPLVLMHGPPSSGKTYLKNRLNELLVQDYKVNVRYTMEIAKDGDDKLRDPFNSQPISLLSCAESFTPRHIQEQFSQSCTATPSPRSLTRYNNLLLVRKLNNENIPMDEFLKVLDEYITLVPIFPKKGGNINITQTDITETLEDVIKTSNRNVLHCDLHDAVFSDIPHENYQTLLSLTDGSFVFRNGESMILDLVIFLYTNWETDIITEKKPFKDRSIAIPFRRNLSWIAERDIIDIKTRFGHKNPHAFNGFTKTTVGTRLKGDTHKDIALIRGYTNDYALYEEPNSGLTSEKIKELFERVRKPNGKPLDGWYDGISLREAIYILNSLDTGGDNCLKPSDVINWLDTRKEISEIAKKFAKVDITDRCITDVVYAYTSLHVGGIEELNKMLEEYDNIFVRSLQETESVTYRGTEMTTADAMVTIEKELCLVGLGDDIRSGITDFMNLQNKSNTKRRPTWRDIMEINPGTSLIALVGTEDVIPWAKFISQDDFMPHERKVISELSTIMIKYLDYCKFCVDDVLTITAKVVRGIKQ